MTEDEVRHLENNLNNAVSKRMASDQVTKELDDSVEIARQQLQAGLYKLFFEDKKYHCPRCGGIMVMEARAYKDEEVSYFMQCSHCKSSSILCPSETATLLEWKRVCDNNEKEQHMYDKLPVRLWKFTGMVPFHTEWIVKAKTPRDAMRILWQEGMDFDRNTWREQPSDVVERRFVYPYWYPGAEEHISGPVCEEEEVKEEGDERDE